MDWEDVNKQAFVTCVQTWVITSNLPPEVAVHVVSLALSLKKADVPSNCLKAVRPFVSWALGGGDRPQWIPEWIKIDVVGPVP